MTARIGRNQRVYIKTYPVQANGMPHASLPTASPGHAAMTEIAEEHGFRNWAVTENGRVRERGGNTDSVLRQAIGVIDVAGLNFTVDYDDTTSPNNQIGTDASVFNHTYCQNWHMWIEEHPQGTGAGLPKISWLVIIRACPKVNDNGAWVFNVQTVGDGKPTLGMQ